MTIQTSARTLIDEDDSQSPQGLPSLMTTKLRSVTRSNQPYMLYTAFIGLLLWFSFASPVFFTSSNFANIGRQTALVSIIAVGMTFVIVSGEIDLSVGSILAVSGMMAALAMQDVSNQWWIGAVVALATGLAFGLVNGLLVTTLRIPSFLVTLGTLGIGTGIALTVSDTQPVLIDNNSFAQLFSASSIAGLPIPIVWTLIAAAAGILGLHFSTFGRKIYASGGNATAARYSGIKVGNVKIRAFLLTGLLAGVAALILSGQSQAARPDFGDGIELDVIAAVILGGTSLFGGRGTIIGTLIGSLTIGIMNNGLVLLGVGSSVQQIIKGAIIIAAVALTPRRKK